MIDCFMLFQNQSSNEGFETKIQDLVGFWEMVNIQVQEVDKNFNEISRLHDNNWILPEEQEKVVYCALLLLFMVSFMFLHSDDTGTKESIS